MRIVAIVVVTLAVVAGGALWFFAAPEAPPPSTSAAPARPAPPVTAPPPAPAPTPAAPPAAAVRPVTPRPATTKPVAPVAPVEARPTTATLRVEADVADAMVLVDRVGVGNAPVTVPDLAPGAHTITVAATGYDSQSQTLTLEPGARTLVVSFKEIRLDARMAAVHKHGMGSCRGQLSASPEGLRYVADDGKDTVSVSFAELDRFEINYLEKNLRIRTRQGRTLNFGDPEGNADRLFVFHRDVDKVRKRIQAGS